MDNGRQYRADEEERKTKSEQKKRKKQTKDRKDEDFAMKRGLGGRRRTGNVSEGNIFIFDSQRVIWREINKH